MTPFWSVMIPTYRTEPRLLQACVASVLANGVEDMEIVIVNDGPPLGFDPGVRVVDNARNLGAPGNFDECVRLAQGEWVHILHADDTVMPGSCAPIGAVMHTTLAGSSSVSSNVLPRSCTSAASTKSGSSRPSSFIASNICSTCIN